MKGSWLFYILLLLQLCCLDFVQNSYAQDAEQNKVTVSKPLENKPPVEIKKNTAKSKIKEVSPKAENSSSNNNKTIWEHPLLIALFSTLFTAICGLLLFIFQKKYKGMNFGKEEKDYRNTLRKNIHLTGISGSEMLGSARTSLKEVFVPLRITTSHQHDRDTATVKVKHDIEHSQTINPEKLIKRAFVNGSLLVITGQPGYGKTTLLKYYALKCLDKEVKDFGLTKGVLPIFLPLRELAFGKENKLKRLPDNLENWRYKRGGGEISADVFSHWLKNKRQGCLVLLDGLDEIRDHDRRKKVCDWLKCHIEGCHKTKFILSCRPAALIGMDLPDLYLQAEVRPFNPEQQETFIKKWYHETLLTDFKPEIAEHKTTKDKVRGLADGKAKDLYQFLTDHEDIRQLSATPLLLQIVTILHYKDDLQIESRSRLYEAILNYLLDERERKRQLTIEVKRDDLRLLLAEIAYQIQISGSGTEEFDEKDLLQFVEIYRQHIPNAPTSKTIIAYLYERAAILIREGWANTDDERDNEYYYVFKHKSYREFLVGIYLQENFDDNAVQKMIWENLWDDWWYEPLLFFANRHSDKIFKAFWRELLKAKYGIAGDKKKWDFVLSLIREAGRKPVDEFVKKLLHKSTSDKLKAFLVECLECAATPAAMQGLYDFCRKYDAKDYEWLISKSRSVLAGHDSDLYSDLITEESANTSADSVDISVFKSLKMLQPFGSLEYIYVCPGSYVDEEIGEQTVEAFYLAKYLITNRQYRRFIRYLEGKENDLRDKLPMKDYADKLWIFAETTKGQERESFHEVLGEDRKQWAKRLRSEYDMDKNFNGDEQPVVGVSWFGSSAFCFWLSCLAYEQKNKLSTANIDELANYIRLPKEKEWLWAAGRPEKGDKLRRYPWGDELEPDKEFANYRESKIGHTTPVGRYPDGASIDGLMDMAGNVWEWQDNWFDSDEDTRALRGGSWDYGADYLRCSARGSGDPDDRDDVIGFRVCLSSPLLTL